MFFGLGSNKKDVEIQRCVRIKSLLRGTFLSSWRKFHCPLEQKSNTRDLMLSIIFIFIRKLLSAYKSGVNCLANLHIY